MIDVSRLGRCCYECGNVDIETNGWFTYAADAGQQNNVQIWCRHWLVCGMLLSEKEELSLEDL